MSNLGDLIKAISADNVSATDVIFNGIGSIADISGAVGGIAGAIDFVTSLLGQSKDQLSPIIDAINAAFNTLNEHQRAADINARVARLDMIWSDAQHVVDSLKATLDANPPVDSGDRITQVSTCRGAIDAIMGFDNTEPAGEFLCVFQDQLYYDDTGTYVYLNFPRTTADFQLVDVGYGPRAPDQDANGQVFSQTYVLPLLFYLESVFLTVGAALIPNFYVEYEASISDDADYLMLIHDKILSGVIRLEPSPWDVPELFNFTWFDDAFSGTSQIVVDDLFGGVRIDYGAVELYSGRSNFAQYLLPLSDFVPNQSVVELKDLPIPIELEDLASNPAVYKKFQLRMERQVRDLYRLAGLTTVWSTANKLRSLIGQNPFSKQSIADYSMRSFCQIAGVGTLSALCKFIEATPPYDTPSPAPEFFSLRSMLAV